MKRFFLAAVVLLLAVQAEAEVKLPALLGSNMVLQRNTEVNFWGEASPRSRVLLTASWDGRTYDAKADAEGRWAMKIATGEAGGPYTVTGSDGKEVVLDNVMLGEVWVCSGQSNMEMPVSGFMFQPVEGAVDAIADAHQEAGANQHPDVRRQPGGDSRNHEKAHIGHKNRIATIFIGQPAADNIADDSPDHNGRSHQAGQQR